MTNFNDTYDCKLQWIRRGDEFDRDQKAIILACSKKRNLWNTYNFLHKQSGLEEVNLIKNLSELVSSNVIKIGFDEELKPVFALRERLEK